MIEYGLQLFSVRSALGEDFKGTIEQLAKIGYKKVETAGFYGLSAEEFGAVIKGNGLTVSGSHCGFNELESDFKGMVNYFKTIGCENCIIAWTDWAGEAFNRSIELFNKYQPMLAAEGINFHFHNHAGEFTVRNKAGYTPMEAILEHTNIGLEIDTYWAFVGGEDPVEYITKHADRIKFVHIKDGSKEGKGCTIGEGQAPVIAVRNAAVDLGFTLVVESEGQKPDGITEVTAGYNFLINN